MTMTVKQESFGRLSDGREVLAYTITNPKGASVKLCEYGASVVSILVQDGKGKFRDIVLGCDCAQDYEKQTAALGAVPGRHANRIAEGKFVLNGQEYALAVNNGPNHLHGGPTGFHRRVWNSSVCGEDSVIFSRFSPDGEEGYPGNLVVSVKYTFDEENRLTISYQALSDKDTVVNLTNHTYFNLDGHASGSVLRQHLYILAQSFTENDSHCLPTGRIVDVASEEGAPFDFRTFTAIGARIDADNIHLKNGSGYDHNYVLQKEEDGLCAKAYSVTSGILLECRTTQPGLQFYTGNFLESANITGKQGAVYHNRDGFCLETQHFPNAMEHHHFPSVVLRAGELYQEKTEFRFDIG